MRSSKRVTGRELAAAYLTAKRAVLAAGYEAEVAWQERACDTPLTEARFLTEAAWVVLNSGMREAVVRRLFPRIVEAFGGLRDARTAYESAHAGGRERALSVFGHPGKIDAIVSIVVHLDRHGLDEIRQGLAAEGIRSLERFAYVGPITAFHLAKNLGYDVAKPDRHLMRIARTCGHPDAQSLCRHVFEFLGEPIPVVDLVFWRFATLCSNYLDVIVGAATGSSSRASSRLATRPAMHLPSKSLRQETIPRRT